MSAEQIIKMPDIGDFSDVEVIEIAVNAGDRVAVGDVLLTVESDKASMDIPADVNGEINGILFAVGDRVSKGDALARVISEDNSAEPTEAPAATDGTAGQKDAEPVTATNPDAMDGTVNAVDSVTPPNRINVESRPRSPAGPSSRRLARELGVDLSCVTGSGKRGRILKEDVKAYAKSQLQKKQTPAAATQRIAALPDLARFGEVERTDLSKVEAVTSANMQRAWEQIPHAWVQKDMDITELDVGRKNCKERVAGLTMTAVFTKALALCLQEFPRFNAAFDSQQSQLVLRKYIHIGVAVDTPRGLVIAVIKNVDQLSIADISLELSRLAEKGRSGNLTPLEMQGSGMTVSNLGGLGVDRLQPVVNWPEVAIVGMGRSSKQAVFDGKDFLPRLIMPVTLGFDHRVINGADAARFLAFLASLLADPVYFMTQA